MFDIGFTELAMLLLIGLLVLGPERLPRAARTVGLYMRKARNAWGSVKQSVEAELDAEELRKALSAVKTEVEGTTKELRKALSEVKTEVEGTSKELQETLEAEIPLAPEATPNQDKPANSDG